MPEVPLCIYCSEVVSADQDDYVIVNKTEEPTEWEYAHVECHADRKKTITAGLVGAGKDS